jgi:hypothetical protein
MKMIQPIYSEPALVVVRPLQIIKTYYSPKQ